jgi:hypothetical protein
MSKDNDFRHATHMIDHYPAEAQPHLTNLTDDGGWNPAKSKPTTIATAAAQVTRRRSVREMLTGTISYIAMSLRPGPKNHGNPGSRMDCDS